MTNWANNPSRSSNLNWIPAIKDEAKRSGPDPDTKTGKSCSVGDIDTRQRYTRITPVRDKVNSKTVKRELYGLHRYGDGRKFPFDFEQLIPLITPVNNFEFLIYKPPNQPQFQFLFGTGNNGRVDCERLESTTRSQYPEDFKFSTVEFDITEVFDGIPHMAFVLV
jgi:hypothetical protein